jgi:hypothetical protein
MSKRSLGYVVLLLLLLTTPASADRDGSVAAEAQLGFRQILETWRMEDYEGLFARIEHPAGKGWGYFIERIVYASRIPACCWEMLQDATVKKVAGDTVVISARLGMEVEGVGTRFVVRDFVLQRINGVWKLPQQTVLDLADYNFQRLPRKIYERQPP